MKNKRDYIAAAGRLFMGAAAGASLYLASMTLARTSLPGCGDGSNCQDVLTSRWAFAFGIPVSFAGFVLYALTLLLSWAYVRRERSFAGLQGAMAVATILAAAVWFTAVQIFALGSFCQWCSLIHASAVAGAFLLWLSRRRHPLPDLDCSNDLRDAGSPFSNDRIFRFTAMGAALVVTGLLALGSLSGPLHRPAAVESSLAGDAVRSIPGGTIGLMDGKYQLQPADYPVLGTAGKEAPVAVLLSDYTCEWCLKNHGILEDVLRSAAPGRAILLLPAARSLEAEDIQRTLLTAFHADPEAWRSLTALITSGQIPARHDDVGRAALQLVTPEKFAASAQSNAERIDAQIRLAASILRDARERDNGNTILPQLYSGSRVLTGAESDPAKILAFLHGADHGPARPIPQPAMKVMADTVTLDALQPGQPQDFEVKVQNRGNAPLKLGWLVLDEGCEITKMPSGRILPNEVAAIGVRFTPPDDGADCTRRIYIHSDSPDSPSQVTLHGKAAARVAAGTLLPEVP